MNLQPELKYYSPSSTSGIHGIIIILSSFDEPFDEPNAFSLYLVPIHNSRIQAYFLRAHFAAVFFMVRMSSCDIAVHVYTVPGT